MYAGTQTGRSFQPRRVNQVNIRRLIPVCEGLYQCTPLKLMEQYLTHQLGNTGFENYHFHGISWREITNSQTTISKLV